MNKRKIINDPIYGLISFPFDHLYDLIDHPYFQRLRRIGQMGLSSYVYPGANHSRFSHALGALHLMNSAITSLRSKDIEISEEEHLAVCQAILLHDIGHGPFSHGLESLLFPLHHEKISLDLMQKLNTEFEGKLELAIKIFLGMYDRPFFHQLVSSQLDMDRMDYLTRDSYYTGVAEGVIGYKRLISMMNIVDNQLVIEEKAVFSIEKFLVARHFMYWQVYLHKTSISSETMLREFVVRLKTMLEASDLTLHSSCFLTKFLRDSMNGTINEDNYVERFTELDDVDVISSLKIYKNHPDIILNYLSNSILERRLFAINLQDKPFSSDFVTNLRHKIEQNLGVSASLSKSLVFKGQETTQAYNSYKQDIKVLKKDGVIVPLSELLNLWINVKKVTKYYLCYPRFIE